MFETKVQVEEVTIKVPWGHISGKWWGPKNIKPIIAVHGWMDNAGSFDRLIPLLPTNLSYLAIDIPGHGYSSWLPVGIPYTVFDFVYAILLVMKHYQWSQISLIGHSMGGAACFLFAVLFGTKCNFVICLDRFISYRFDNKNEYLNMLRLAYEKIIAIDEKNQNKFAIEHTYKDVVSAMSQGYYKYVGEQYIPYILNRGIKPSENEQNKFNFTRDAKLNYILLLPFDLNDLLKMARTVHAPVCVIRGSREEDENFKKDENLKNHEEQMLEVLKESNKEFVVHEVHGNHYLHLNDATCISNILTNFIQKYYQKQVIGSKL